jgi:hypothetical protein
VGSLLPESLDVAAGLVFVYLFMSVLATVAREAFEGFMKRRSRNLEKGLIELLCDQPAEKTGPKRKGKKTLEGYEVLQSFYDHPLIMSLYRGRYTIPPKRHFLQGRSMPSYVPSSHFAYVILDMLSERGGQGTDQGVNLNAVMEGSRQLGNPRLARMVQFAVSNAGGDAEKARLFLENWFNATMDRVSGWYRLETQTFLFWVSLVACVVLNVNTVVIADALYRSPTLRKGVEVAAETYYQKHAAGQLQTGELQTLGNNPLNELGLPLGWTQQTRDAMARLFAREEARAVDPQAMALLDVTAKDEKGWTGQAASSINSAWQEVVNFYYGTPGLGDNTLFNFLPFVSLIMGWVMTAFAVTLGAPFWFDVLSKLMVVRSTFKPGGGGQRGDGLQGTVSGLTALAATLAPPQPAVQETKPFLSFAPGNTQAAVVLQDDLPVDPNQRPRDA